MGEVILKSAAVVDIEADASLTLSRAAAFGPRWLPAATQFLGGVVPLAARLAARVEAAQTDVTQARYATTFVDERVDDALANIHDRYFNAVGRPGRHVDAVYELHWPSGSGGYRKLPPAEQVAAMEVLAELLGERLHEDVDEETTAQMKAEVDALTAELGAAVEAQKKAERRLAQLTKARRAVATFAQVQLARLKRQWRSQGRSEADIHDIIPDRPTNRGKPEDPKG